MNILKGVNRNSETKKVISILATRYSLSDIKVVKHWLCIVKSLTKRYTIIINTPSVWDHWCNEFSQSRSTITSIDYFDKSISHSRRGRSSTTTTAYYSSEGEINKVARICVNDKYWTTYWFGLQCLWWSSSSELSIYNNTKTIKIDSECIDLRTMSNHSITYNSSLLVVLQLLSLDNLDLVQKYFTLTWESSLLSKHVAFIVSL